MVSKLDRRTNENHPDLFPHIQGRWILLPLERIDIPSEQTECEGHGLVVECGERRRALEPDPQPDRQQRAVAVDECGVGRGAAEVAQHQHRAAGAGPGLRPGRRAGVRRRVHGRGRRGVPLRRRHGRPGGRGRPLRVGRGRRRQVQPRVAARLPAGRPVELLQLRASQLQVGLQSHIWQ